MGLFDVVDGCEGGGVHVVLRSRDPHRFQLVDIVGDRFCRIVGQEGVADSGRFGFVEEIYGKGEQTAPEVDGSVHIQGQVANLRKLRPEFRREGFVMVFFHESKG